MKKLLTLFWVIIIVGSVIIVVNFFSPESEPNGVDLTTETTEEETTTSDLEALEETQPEEITKTYSQYIQEGDTHLANLLITSAIDSYTKATILNPNSSEPLIKLGEAYLQNNDPKNAQTALEKALILDENSTTIKIGIARSYLNQRNIEAAKNLVWEMSTEDPLVKYYTAMILILYKDFDGSKNLFTELATTQEEAENSEQPIPQIDPEIIENSQIFLSAYETFSYFTGGEKLHLQTLLAKALTDVDEFETSIPLLYDIINEKNNYRDAWIILGYAYLNTDKILDAIDAFTQAKGLDEEKPETLFFLGLAHFANNAIDKAVIYLELADENGYEPKDQINAKLGDLYLLQQEYKKSSAKYEKVLAKNTTNMGVFIRVTWLNIDKLNDPEKALEYAYIALENHPDDAMSYNLVGWSLTALENYKEAEKYLAKAIEMDPEFDAAALNMGWFYEKQGQKALAKEYYKRAYALGDNNSIATLAATRYNNLQLNIQVNTSAP